MRLWMVDPSLMCRKHLLGEHVECHMFVGTLLKDISVNGYLSKGLLEVHNLRSRHEEISREMTKRGYSHKSELPEFVSRECGSIDRAANLLELARRCPLCRDLIKSKK